MSQKFTVNFAKNLLAGLAVSTAFVACKPGAESEKSPIHLNPNMDLQEKYKAQEESQFFEDGRTMRTPVAGTVSRVELNDGSLAVNNPRLNDHLYEGKIAGQIADTYPTLKELGFASKEDLLKRGQARYDIYCAPCHDETGKGSGMAVKRGAPQAADLTKTVRKVGDIYGYIKNGGPIMPAYAHQIPVADRWAITAYVEVIREAAKPSKAEAAAEAKAAADAAASMTPAQKGKIASASCLACHSVKKGSEPGKLGPTWYGLFPKSGVKTRKVKVGMAGADKEIQVTEAYVRESIRNPNAFLAYHEDGMFKGQAMPGMVPYSAEMLSDEQVEAIIAYMKTLND